MLHCLLFFLPFSVACCGFFEGAMTVIKRSNDIWLWRKWIVVEKEQQQQQQPPPLYTMRFSSAWRRRRIWWLCSSLMRSEVCVLSCMYKCSYIIEGVWQTVASIKILPYRLQPPACLMNSITHKPTYWKYSHMYYFSPRIKCNNKTMERWVGRLRRTDMKSW